MKTKLKLFHGYEIDEVEQEVNEWLESFPKQSTIRNMQMLYQMDADVPMTEGFCIAIWYEEKPHYSRS